jgi:plasmid maintenance system antidote protein VapI
MNKKKPMIPDEIIMIEIMEQMGWTYDEYIDTPIFIINLIISKKNADLQIRKNKDGR